MSLARGRASPAATLVNTDRRVDDADGAFIIQLMRSWSERARRDGGKTWKKTNISAGSAPLTTLSSCREGVDAPRGSCVTATCASRALLLAFLIAVLFFSIVYSEPLAGKIIPQL